MLRSTLSVCVVVYKYRMVLFSGETKMQMLSSVLFSPLVLWLLRSGMITGGFVTS